MLEIVGSHLAKSSNIGYNGPKYLCVRPEAFRVCRDYCSESICDSQGLRTRDSKGQSFSPKVTVKLS